MHTCDFRRRSSGPSRRRPTSIAVLDFKPLSLWSYALFFSCYASSERLFPNHKGLETSGGSHGNDTAGDGASLTAPQPYTGEETRVPPECLRFPVSTGWNREGRNWQKSDGRIPRRLRRRGGQKRLDGSADTPTTRIASLPEHLATPVLRDIPRDGYFRYQYRQTCRSSPLSRDHTVPE